jgi:addiction module HigA family antidote
VKFLKGNRRMTTDTALRFSKYFQNSAQFWLGLHNDYDLEDKSTLKEKELSEVKPFKNFAV